MTSLLSCTGRDYTNVAFPHDVTKERKAGEEEGYKQIRVRRLVWPTSALHQLRDGNT